MARPIEVMGRNCWKVPSFSRDDRNHIVSIKAWGWDCTCEYNQYRRKECDHIKRVRHKKLQFHGRSAYRHRMVRKATWQYLRLFLELKRYSDRSDAVEKILERLKDNDPRRIKYKREMSTILTQVVRVSRKADKLREKYPEIDREIKGYKLYKRAKK